MNAQNAPEPQEGPHLSLVRPPVPAGAPAVSTATVAAEPVTVAEPSAGPGRTDLFHYWESQQRSLGFSQGIRVDNTVWLSGTAALDKDFQPVSPDDLPSQMKFIYQRIEESLGSYGLDFRHVVRENMYVTDMAALVGALPYRKSVYGDGPFPTSTTLQVNQLLLPGLMIEIEVTACRALP